MTPTVLTCATIATANPSAAPGTPNLTIVLLPLAELVECAGSGSGSGSGSGTASLGIETM